jgi:hypothetical protein
MFFFFIFSINSSISWDFDSEIMESLPIILPWNDEFK